jgi:hypothetical protein
MQKGNIFPSTVSDMIDDSGSDMTVLGLDRTCDMISDRAWDGTGNMNGDRTG